MGGSWHGWGWKSPKLIFLTCPQSTFLVENCIMKAKRSTSSLTPFVCHLSKRTEFLYSWTNFAKRIFCVLDLCILGILLKIGGKKESYLMNDTQFPDIFSTFCFGSVFGLEHLLIWWGSSWRARIRVSLIGSGQLALFWQQMISPK